MVPVPVSITESWCPCEVYGNVSKYFGKKREEDGHTHQWTVYVKPFRSDLTGNVLKPCSLADFNSHGR
jgi:YEATS domain-containing protein 4